MTEKEILLTILGALDQIQMKGRKEAEAYLECIKYLDKKIEAIK